MAAYHTPAEQPRGVPRGLFRRSTTKLGHRALQSVGMSAAFLVAMIFGEGIGGPVFLVGVAGVIGFFVLGVVAGWVAIIRQGERAPGVFVVAFVAPALMALNAPAAAALALIVVATFVVNEIRPRRSR